MKLDQVKKEKIFRGISDVIRICIGCLFIYSSFSKIRQPYDFLSDVYNYELVGPKLGMIVAMVMPWMELFVGIALVGGIFIGGALLMSIGLGAMFTFVIGWALYLGLDISCGCFSSSAASGKVSYMTLIRALAIMLLSVTAYIIVFFQKYNNQKNLQTT